MIPQNSVKKLLYPQDKFINSPKKFPAIVGTWGCGKSLAGLYSIHLACQNHPGNLALIIRKEFVDLRDSTMQDWKSEIGLPINGDKNVVYPNGATVMFRHGDDIDSLKNTNLGDILIVQGEEMTEQEFWFLVGRLRRKQGALKLRVEANYNGHNWIYKLWKKRDINIPLGSEITAEDFHLVETCTLDNKENLPKSYIASLEMLPEKLKRRHYLGSWEEAQGLVYDEFSELRHVVKPFVIPDGWEKGFVLDHGFTNPTAVLWYAIDHDANVYFYDEHYEAGKPISHHADRIKERSLTSGYADPSIFANNQSRAGTGDIYSLADEYRDCGISLTPATKEVENARIARVNEFFKGGRIRIFEGRCPNLIEEINNWKWRENTGRKEMNAPEEPEDKNNHACDTVGYLIASRFTASPKQAEKAEKESLVWHQNRVKLLMAQQDAMKSVF